MIGSFEFDDEVFHYDWWNGERLKGSTTAPLSYDTETERIRACRAPLPDEDHADVPTDPLHVPRAALAMAFDGQRLVLIHPSQLAAFVVAHRSQHWVGHNFAFDWWVTARCCGRATQEILWQLGDASRLHDTQLLDMLLQLGTGKYRHGAAFRPGVDEQRLYPANLGALSAELGCGELDKTDPYRLRFGELLGKSKAEMEAHPEATGFFSYALKDVVATWRVYQKQRDLGLAVMKRAGWSSDRSQKKYEIRPDAVEKFGVLSETLQTKASIVLAELSRTPLRIDQAKREAAEASARARYMASLETLLAVEPELIKKYKVKAKRGTVKITKKSLLPQFDQKKLAAVLEDEALRLNCLPLKSDGKKKGTSTSARLWKRFADRSEFIAAWAELEKEAKLLEFLTAINAPVVYSHYSILMMNGRTSAGAHRRKGETLVPSVNVQQMPREDPQHPERSVRTLFLPPEGMKWYSCDYGFIELCALAAVCRARFGWSKLGDAIAEYRAKGGVDPHQRTAAMILGLTPAEFLQLPKDTQKTARQQAKACFHPDVEVLTPRGWVCVADLTTADEVAQFLPDSGKAEWVKPLALTSREAQPLVRVYNENVDVRVTPDHRMLGYTRAGKVKVGFPDSMNTFHGVWNAARVSEGDNPLLDPDNVRRVACIQAEGSVTGNAVWFGFTKQKKIERFLSLFPEAKRGSSNRVVGKTVTSFCVPWRADYETLLSRKKVFDVVGLLALSPAQREVFLDETTFWDGNHSESGKRAHYYAVVKENVDAVQAVAAASGRKSIWATSESLRPNRRPVYTIVIKNRDYSRGGDFRVDELPGLHTVYCLSVPSTYLIVRDGGKTLCVGNCNFGLPGGLGVAKFVEYAKASYGVDFTKAEAKNAKKKWLALYEELKLYLGDHTQEAMAWQTGKKAPALGWLERKRLSDFVRADDAQRKEFTPEESNRWWEYLEGLAYQKGDEKLINDVDSRKMTSRIRQLLTYRACTLTGRVRANVTYTDGANTPFSGLAADGAKLAMWNLMRRGTKILSFVHDALDVAIDPRAARSQCAVVEKVMVESMQEVIGQGVPVAVDGALADCWAKA